MHEKSAFLTALMRVRSRRMHTERPPYISIFFKTGIGVMAALCVAVGVSAYADNGEMLRRQARSIH